MVRKDLPSPHDRLVKPASSAPRGLDGRLLEKIGSSLKAHYDDLVHTPVPKRFLELLDGLEAKEQTSNIGNGADEPG